MKTFIKKNIRFIIIVIICITCSVLTTFATTTLFNSSEVYYNNTTSGIQADKVQGAIDELYACASNYAAYNQRLTNAESTIGSGSLTTTSQNLIGAVNGLNEQIGTLNNKFEIKSVTGQTSGNGNITLSEFVSTSVVIAAWSTNTNTYVCIPYITTGKNKWGVHVINDSSSGSAVESTSMTIQYVVMKK